MSQSKFCRAGILSAALLFAACGDRTGDLEQIKDQVLTEQQNKQRLAARRLSALDGRFEKAEKKYADLGISIESVEHPLKKDESVSFRDLYNDVVIATAHAEDLLITVSRRLRQDNARGVLIAANLQGCDHLVTYHDKHAINADEMQKLLQTLVLEKAGVLDASAYKIKNDLYVEFGFGSFPDLDRAEVLLNQYEASILAYEQALKDAEPAVESARKTLTEPFMKLWDKRVTVNLGLAECEKQYKAYQDLAALHGFVPK